MKYISLREAAIRLGIRLDGAYELAWVGKLEGAHKVDGRWRIPIESVAKRLALRKSKRK